MLKDIANMRSRWTYAAAALIALALPTCATAQDAAQKGAYGDWAKQCESAPGGGERCYLIQTVKADDQPVMVVIVAYSPQRDRIAAMIDVPLGMHIPSGLDVRTEGVDKHIDFEQCLPTGCRAMLPMDDALIAALKKGMATEIAGKGRNGADVALPISPQGFSEAFGAL